MHPIGVLALQGDFAAHGRALAGAGARVMEVRRACDLESVAGLVIPGGESSTMLKLIEEEALLEPLRDYALRRPVFGTCAGAILMASEVIRPEQPSLGLLDIAVERNAYGRQVHSRVASVVLETDPDRPLEVVFIRAPVIFRTGPGVRVLARWEGKAVVVEQGLHLAATFHPELTGDRRLHELFLDKVRRCPG